MHRSQARVTLALSPFPFRRFDSCGLLPSIDAEDIGDLEPLFVHNRLLDHLGDVHINTNIEGTAYGSHRVLAASHQRKAPETVGDVIALEWSRRVWDQSSSIVKRKLYRLPKLRKLAQHSFTSFPNPETALHSDLAT